MVPTTTVMLIGLLASSRMVLLAPVTLATVTLAGPRASSRVVPTTLAALIGPRASSRVVPTTLAALSPRASSQMVVLIAIVVPINHAPLNAPTETASNLPTVNAGARQVRAATTIIHAGKVAQARSASTLISNATLQPLVMISRMSGLAGHNSRAIMSILLTTTSTREHVGQPHVLNAQNLLTKDL
jgi:hypothetical protein